jgi:hypothetical protein
MIHFDGRLINKKYLSRTGVLCFGQKSRKRPETLQRLAKELQVKDPNDDECHHGDGAVCRVVAALPKLMM